MADSGSFQRIGAISNAHVGVDFELAAQKLFAWQGLHLERDFRLTVGIDKKKKAHRFDLGSALDKVAVECKSHRWTKGRNVPSAKMTVWNEAMYYFTLLPADYRKILFVLRDYNSKKKETLAQYYLRTYDHLLPEGVEVWEYDEKVGEVDVWKAINS